MTWYIEDVDGTYIVVSHSRLNGLPSGMNERTQYDVTIKKVSKLKLDGNQRLTETSKESVIKALKKGLEILDLPKDIKTLKHNF